MSSTKKPDHPFPEGFTFHRPDTASNVLGRCQAAAGLFLPSKLVGKLLAESERRIAAEEEAELKRQAEIDDSRRALKTTVVLPAPPTATKVLSQDQLIEAMKRKLQGVDALNARLLGQERRAPADSRGDVQDAAAYNAAKFL